MKSSCRHIVLRSNLLSTSLNLASDEVIVDVTITNVTLYLVSNNSRRLNTVGNPRRERLSIRSIIYIW